LDLEPIIIKAMDSEEGYGWTFAFADRVADEYRRFLILCLEHRQDSKYLIVPSKLVDKFWHLHILDTRKYIEDCQYCFGSMLHHFPYFGMRGDQDAANLREAWSRTLALYQSTFNVEPPAEIWPHSKSEIGIRYRDVKREDANPAHRRFDCRRPRLADLERLNGTSHRLEAVKVRLPKWKWKRLHLVPISSIFAFAAVLILAVGTRASNGNNTAAMSFDSLEKIFAIFSLSSIMFAFMFELISSSRSSSSQSSLEESSSLSSHPLYDIFWVIYTKVESIQDDHVNQYGKRLTIAKIRQAGSIGNIIAEYMKYDKGSSDHLSYYFAFWNIYAKIEAIQANQYGKRLTIDELQQNYNYVVTNAIDSYMNRRSSGGGSYCSGGGCGGGGCGG